MHFFVSQIRKMLKIFKKGINYAVFSFIYYKIMINIVYNRVYFVYLYKTIISMVDKKTIQQ